VGRCRTLILPLPQSTPRLVRCIISLWSLLMALQSWATQSLHRRQPLVIQLTHNSRPSSAYLQNGWLKRYLKVWYEVFFLSDLQKMLILCRPILGPLAERSLQPDNHRDEMLGTIEWASQERSLHLQNRSFRRLPSFGMYQRLAPLFH
jgi:hypothetical protein